MGQPSEHVEKEEEEMKTHFPAQSYAALVTVLALLFSGLALSDAPVSYADGSPSCPYRDPSFQQTANFSVACLPFQWGPMDHVWDEFNNNQLWMDASLSNITTRGHVNQGVWGFSGDPCIDWVEMGLTYGTPDPGNPNIWLTEYHLYTGYGVPQLGYGGGISHGIQPIDGSHHTYDLVYAGVVDGKQRYNFYRDSNLIRTLDDPNLGFGMCKGQAGLEMKPRIQPDTREFSATFDHDPLEFHVSGDPWWYYWNGPPNQWVDYPCGAGYNPPNCLNGTYYGAHHWAANTGR